MDILAESQSTLERAGYHVIAKDVSKGKFFFEDDCLVGMVMLFGGVDILLKSWRAWEEEFHLQFARQFAKEPTKAWNAYTILLSPDEVPNADIGKISSIEEDLQRSRKIVGTGITNISQLNGALLPLLPIKLFTASAPTDPLTRLRERAEIPEIADSKDLEALFAVAKGPHK